MPDIWGLAAIITKVALYLGILTAVGTILVALVFRSEHYKPPAMIFAVLGLAASVLAFFLGGANLTGDVSGMTDPDILGLLWSTSVGTAVFCRVLGLGLIIAGLFLGRSGLWLSGFGGLAALWSFPLVSHVSTRDTALLDGALVVHLGAVAFWIGILIPLRRLARSPAHWPDAVDLGHRFGLVARGVIPALILAGVYLSYMLVGSVAALLGTGYGQALILKVALVAGLLGLGAANKLRFIPALRAGDPHAASHLSRSISVEWGVILSMMIVTAILTSTLALPT